MEKTRDQYVAEQRALLEDPIAWVHKAWDALIGSGPLDSLLCSDLPKEAWDNKDEALKVAALAARTPGADVKRCLGEASDCANDLATEMHAKGLELGAILEQLRQGLLRVHDSLLEPDEHAQWQAQELAELRAKLTEVDHA